MISVTELRRVDWPIVVGPDVRAPAPGPARHAKASSALSALDELACYDDLDVLLRRAVELLRDRIGLERAAIFLFCEEDNLLHGSWGTGHLGQTTDERRIAFAVGPNHTEAFYRTQSDSDRWLRLDHVPRTVQIGGETRVLEHGWIVLTPIVSARGQVGLLSNDGAVSRAPMVEAQQDQAAVFCSLLANLIELRRDEAGVSPRQSSFRAREPGLTARTELVSRAIELMRRAPKLDRDELAAQLGVSGDKLGRAFKVELGCSLTDYRNRLRIETFLLLVERSDGNLLEAALNLGSAATLSFTASFAPFSVHHLATTWRGRDATSQSAIN